VGRISWRHPNLPQPFYGSGSSAMTIIRNAKFRILPPQPASPVSAPQNRALPRHFANTARSPCRELGYRSAIPAPWSPRSLFGVSFLLDGWTRDRLPLPPAESMRGRRGDLGCGAAGGGVASQARPAEPPVFRSGALASLKPVDEPV
jgi:hypothetical protein